MEFHVHKLDCVLTPLGDDQNEVQAEYQETGDPVLVFDQFHDNQ